MNDRGSHKQAHLLALDSRLQLLEEPDFETSSDQERQIWTAAQLRDLPRQAKEFRQSDESSPSATKLDVTAVVEPVEQHVEQIIEQPSAQTWLHGLSLVGRANYHSPSHVIAPEIFGRHYEIIFVDKGRQTHWLDGRCYVLQSGDCFLIRPLQQHSTAQKPEERGRFYWWIFDPADGFLGLDKLRSQQLIKAICSCFASSGAAVGGAATALRHLDPKKALLMRNNLASLFVEWSLASQRNLQSGGLSAEQQLLSWEQSLLDLFFLILQNQQQNRPYRRRQQQVSKQVLGQVPKQVPGKAPRQVNGVLQAESKPQELTAATKFGGDNPAPRATMAEGHSQDYLSKLCDYISSHIYDNLTFEELLRQTPYSEPHLLRLFRNEYGLPLRDYINREKIYKAQELLLQGIAVTTIAAELCFSSSQYFAVVFRRYAGCSPSSWRKKSI